ncbi:MAG: hypothetical protein Q8N69_00835 [bacterium]|nr:hypothetical protein [bacterium]
MIVGKQIEIYAVKRFRHKRDGGISSTVASRFFSRFRANREAKMLYGTRNRLNHWFGYQLEVAVITVI